MTGHRSPAGAGPRCEDGPGLPLPDPFGPAAAVPVPGLTAPDLAGAATAAELVLRLGDHAGAALEILVVDQAGRTLQRLGPFHEDEAIAVWRGLNQASGLPLAIEAPDGTRERPYPQVGRVLLGAIRIRRRHGLLAGRRPRFLVRRKTARLPVRPHVHREREIFAGATV